MIALAVGMAQWLESVMFYYEPYGPIWTFVVEAGYSMVCTGIYAIWRIYPDKSKGETQLTLSLNKKRAL